jgi:transketolase
VTARLAVEAAAPQGWHEWVGSDGEIIGMTEFGESAPAKDLFKHFGFTVDNVVDKVKKMVASKS